MTVPHNFELSEDQTMVLDTLRKLVQDQAEPQALEHDEHCRFVRGNFDQLAEMGMLGLPVGEDSGGAGMGWLTFAVGLEEISAACGSTGRLWLSQAGLCAVALEGSSKGDLCAELAAGEKIGAWIGPECGVRCDADGDGYRLSGCAAMVTAATEAAVFVVAASDAEGVPQLFVLDASAVAVEPVAALGFRASAPGSVALDGVAVAADALAASGTAAEAALARASLAAMIGGGAIACGMARASVEASRRHTSERQAFGKPLFAQQAVQHKLVESLRMTQSARHGVYHAARLADRGEDATREAMMAKLDAVEAAVLSADEGIQVHGGYGYVVEYHVERHYRDAKTLELMDGGAEKLRDSIAAGMAP